MHLLKNPKIWNQSQECGNNTVIEQNGVERSDEAWKQYAIRSDVQGDACTKNPVGVYTKVAPYLDWIKSKLEY